MRCLLVFLFVPLIALAQSAPATAFPEGSVPLEAEALQRFLTGKTFWVKPVEGSEFRMGTRDSYAYINIGANSDTGRWKAVGSTVCIEWQKFTPACYPDARMAGGVLYVKRTNTGEVVPFRP